jgi:hypothetical protein
MSFKSTSTYINGNFCDKCHENIDSNEEYLHCSIKRDRHREDYHIHCTPGIQKESPW